MNIQTLHSCHARWSCAYAWIYLNLPVFNLSVCTQRFSLIDSAGDADSSRAPGLTSGLQGSVNVHRGALLLVPQWRCISSFVFYIIDNHENDHDDNDNHGEISRKCW